MSTQASPRSADDPTPFDDTIEGLMPGVRQAHAPAPGAGCWGAKECIANGELLERLAGEAQWLRRSFQAGWQPCRRGRRAWVITSPESGFGKTHFLNSLAQRLDGDALVVGLGTGTLDGVSPYWERVALSALVQALDRAEAGGARVPASTVSDRFNMPAIESHWIALARGVLAGAVRELLAASAQGTGDGSTGAGRLREVAEALPPDLQRTTHWKSLLDHVLGTPAFLEILESALDARGFVTNARLTTWLNVFHTLLFADDLELRAACRRWIGGRPVEAQLCDQMGVDESDRLALEGDGEIARQQALERIADLSHFAACYVPFVFCVEYEEPDRGSALSEATGRTRRPLPREQDPLAQMLETLSPSLAHALLVVAMDQRSFERCFTQWSDELVARTRKPVPLQGLGSVDASRLIDARLRAAATNASRAAAMIGDSAWWQTGAMDGGTLSARSFLDLCADRYRSCVSGTGDRNPGDASPAVSADVVAAPSAPTESFDAAWEAAREQVGEPTPVQVHDALVPLLEGLGEHGVADVRVLPGDPPLTQLCWQRARVRFGLAVGIADTRQRWGQLARRALLGEKSVTVCLRLPREMVVPNPAWPVAASMLERAMGAGRLRVVRLTDPQCVDIATAAVLYEGLQERLDEGAMIHAWQLIGDRLRWLTDLLLESEGGQEGHSLENDGDLNE